MRDVKLSSFLRVAASPTATTYARAKVESGKTPWRNAHFSVVDLELSGLDPHHDEIISYAAVPIDFGRVVAGNTLYGLCRPTRRLSEQSILVHGIRMQDLAEAPSLDEAMQPLIAAMSGRVLVAHVAWVERSFLGQAFVRQGIRLREPVIDTYELGQLLAFERKEPPAARTLDELARSLALPVHQQHHALGDALTTAQVFITLATHLDNFRSETVRSLARAKQRAGSYLG
jgi:DNA polymerase-3 subunit epsilon